MPCGADCGKERGAPRTRRTASCRDPAGIAFGLPVLLSFPILYGSVVGVNSHALEKCSRLYCGFHPKCCPIHRVMLYTLSWLRLIPSSSFRKTLRIRWLVVP